LVQHQWKSGRWIHDLLHHDKQLADNDGLVELILNNAKIFFIESNAFIINNENSETMVVRIHQDAFWDLKAYELGNFCELSFVQDDVLVLCVVLVAIVEADVDALLSVDLVSVLAEAGSDFEAGDDTIFVSEFISKFIWSFCFQPLFSPGFEVKSATFNFLVVTLLEFADELGEVCV